MSPASPIPGTELLDGQVVLVTGASGYLGERLVNHLSGLGARVYGTWHSRPIRFEDADSICVDLADRTQTTRTIAKVSPTVIVHCAAMTDVAACERDPAAARRAIVETTASLLALRTETGTPDPAHMIHISTDLVFDGEYAPYSPESTPKPLSEYGSLKWEAEKLALDGAAGCVLRSALMYGPPGTHAGSFLAWMVRTLAQGQDLPLFEDEVRTPVLVDDVCRAIAALVANPAPGVWHAGGPERLTRFVMGQQVCAAFGFDEKRLVPRRLAESNYAAPRPRDVSLLSGALWNRVAIRPQTFQGALALLRDDFQPLLNQP